VKFDKLVESYGTERTRALKTLNSTSASTAATVRALDRFSSKLTALRYSAEPVDAPPLIDAANTVFIQVIDQTKDALKNMSLGTVAGSDLRYEQGRLDFNEAGQTLGATIRTLTPAARMNLCRPSDFYTS
jgi:hypothetical protein